MAENTNARRTFFSIQNILNNKISQYLRLYNINLKKLKFQIKALKKLFSVDLYFNTEKTFYKIYSLKTSKGRDLHSRGYIPKVNLNDCCSMIVVHV